MKWGGALALLGLTASLQAWDLETITVTGTKVPQRLADTPVATEVISAAQIEATGASDLTGVLAAYGLITDGSTSHGDQVLLEGLGASRVLFLVDGRKVVGRVAQNVDGTSIPLVNVDRIEIVRGPQSALYGSDAMGGVVNIITRAPRNHWSGRITFENAGLPAYDDLSTVQSPQMGPAPFQSQRVQGSVDFPWGETRNTLSLTGSRSSYFWNETGEKSLLPRSWLGKLALDSQSSSHTDQRWTWGGSATSIREENQTDQNKTVERRDLYRAEAYGTWTFPALGGLWELKASNQGYGRVSDTLTKGVDVTASSLEFEDRTESSLWYTLDLSDENFLTLGLEATWDLVRDDDLQVPGGWLVEDRQALVLQDTHVVEDAASMAAGLRIERQSTFGWFAAPKVSAMVSPVQGLRFLAGTGVGFRAPSAEDRYSNIDWSWHPIVRGNADLKPETSWAGNLDVEGSLPGLFIRLHGFHQELFDEIVYSTVGTATDGRTIYRNENRNRSSRTGTETEVRWSWEELWSVEAASAWQHAWDRTANLAITTVPVHSWRATASATPGWGLRFRLEVRDDSLRGAPVWGGSFGVAHEPWEANLRAENLTGVIHAERGPHVPVTVRLGVTLKT